MQATCLARIIAAQVAIPFGVQRKSLSQKQQEENLAENKHVFPVEPEDKTEKPEFHGTNILNLTSQQMNKMFFIQNYEAVCQWCFEIG